MCRRGYAVAVTPARGGDLRGPGHREPVWTERPVVLAVGIVLLAALYVAGAAVGLRIAFVRASVTTIWPSAGLALAVLLLVSPRLWPGILVGSAAGSMLGGAPIPAALGIGLGSALQAALAAWILREIVRLDTGLRRTRDVLGLVGVGAMATTVVAATAGAVSLAAFSSMPWERVPAVWLAWWLGDASGVVLVAPLLLTWGTRQPIRIGGWHLVEAAVLVVALVTGAHAVFLSDFRFPVFLVPLLAWAALRFGPRGAAAASAMVGAMAIVGTLRGAGPFAAAGAAEDLLVLQAFLGVAVLTAMILAAAFAERDGAVAALQEARGALKQRVSERTAELAAANAALRTEIGQRERVEHALRESEKTARALLDAVTDLALLLDDEGRVVGANEAAGERLGRDPSQLVGEDVFAMLTPELARARRSAMEAVLATGRPLRFEDRDGDVAFENVVYPVVDASGRVTRVAVFARDVTETRRGEATLRESEERYRGVVEVSPDGIGIIEDGTLVFVNPAGARMLGYDDPAQVIGRDPLAFVHPDSEPSLRSRLAAVAETGRAEGLAQERLLRHDGRVLDVEIAAVPFTLDGRPAVQIIARDVTARRELEQQLRHAQKMEAVGRLAGGVAHDFNNLLQALLSELEVLRMRRDDDAQFHASVREASEQIRRGASLVRQLLLFARRDVACPRPVELNGLVRSMATLLQRLLRENIRLGIQLADGVLVTEADAGQLEQVLVNLVVNACDAMPEGGSLDVSTGLGPGDTVWLDVVDSGLGMPPEIVERVFEPFFTTKEEGRGTGLGLAVVHDIVTAAGGAVSVESRVGRGTSFRVVLPRSGSGTTVEPCGVGSGQDLPAGCGERILVVEDESATRDGLHDLLAMLGYNVVAVASGEEAVALPSEEPFDLLLTDLLLPGVHGGEVARVLTDRWPDMAVILMSGYADGDAGAWRGGEDGVRFLQKPFGMAVLAREIQAALALQTRGV